MNTFADSAKSSAMKAYYFMEESPFDRDAFKKAILILNSAYKSDPNEPWVYIAYSLATMQSGYRIGSWYRLKSFNKGIIEKAQQLAEKAKELGENESQSHAHLARILIIKKEYKKHGNY